MTGRRMFLLHADSTQTSIILFGSTAMDYVSFCMIEAFDEFRHVSKYLVPADIVPGDGFATKFMTNKEDVATVLAAWDTDARVIKLESGKRRSYLEGIRIDMPSLRVVREYISFVSLG